MQLCGSHEQLRSGECGVLRALQLRRRSGGSGGCCSGDHACTVACRVSRHTLTSLALHAAHCTHAGTAEQPPAPPSSRVAAHPAGSRLPHSVCCRLGCGCQPGAPVVAGACEPGKPADTGTCGTAVVLRRGPGSPKASLHAPRPQREQGHRARRRVHSAAPASQAGKEAAPCSACQGGATSSPGPAAGRQHAPHGA